MNRFNDSQGVGKIKSGKSKAGNIVLFVLFFCILMVMFNMGINQLTQVNEQQQIDSVRNAVVRAVIKYYAIEGRFPPSIAYLTENHSLMVDQERFIVHYNLFADNIMPIIDVMPREF